MELALAVVVGVLYAAGFYLLLRRSIVKVALGLVMLGHAANLLIFVAAGLTRSVAPILTSSNVSAKPADPLPQALVLTAIVIGFGVLSFFLALSRRASRILETDDVDRMREVDS